MRMPASQRRSPSTLNLTPMIDMVFLLIVFFLLSSHFARQDRTPELVLPEASSGEEVGPRNTRLLVNMNAEGVMEIDGKPVTIKDLNDRLAVERDGRNLDLEVHIRTDRRIPYSAIEPVLLACAQAGIWNVNFTVAPREGPP